MIEKINKVNEALESLIEKLKNNYERLERKAIETGKDLDEDATHSEYEALALIKKEAIINKVLYQYYSQKLRNVMDRAESSIVDLITLNGKNDVFEVEVNSRDYMNNIDLEELCKGVRSFAVTDELISSFEMFSGSNVAPNETKNEFTTQSKIEYEENDSKEYDIKPTDDEQALKMAGSSVAPITEELMNAGSSEKTMSKEEMEAGSCVEPLDENLLNAGSSSAPITEELMNAGSSEKTMSKEELEAGSNVAPLDEALLNAGSSVAPITEELMNAGSSKRTMSKKELQAKNNKKYMSKKLATAGSNVKAVSEEELNAGSSSAPITEELMNAGSSEKTMSKEEMQAGSDAEPFPEGLLSAGSSSEPKN